MTGNRLGISAGPDPPYAFRGGTRACMVVYSYYPEDPRVAREARTLADAGVSVDIVCLRGPDQPSNETSGGISVYRLPLVAHKGSGFRYAWQYGVFFLLASVVVSRLVLGRRPDVVHVHSLPDFLVFSTLMPRLFGSHIVLDLHEAMPEILAARLQLLDTALLVRMARVLERISASFAHDVFVVNGAVRDLLVSRGIHSAKLRILPNSPSETDIEPSTRRAVFLRWGLSPRHLLVVAGGLNPERDLETLIQSVGLLRASRSVGLLILGRGDNRYVAKLQVMIRDLELSDRVVLGGFAPHRAALGLLALSEVGVVTFVDNPLTRLTLPNRMFEFAMLGKPLVVPHLPTMQAFLGPSARYYEPGNPKDLARAIVAALDSDNTEMLADLRRRYEELRWPSASRHLLEVYARGLPTGTRRSEAKAIRT